MTATRPARTRWTSINLMGVRISLFFLLLATALPGQSQPVIGPGGVVNSADNSDAWTHGLAQGSLFTIYGTNLAVSQGAVTALPLSPILDSVRVWVTTDNAGNRIPAPLLYVSPGQINAVLPSTVPVGTRAVAVEVNGVVSASSAIMVTRTRFAAFTRSARGFGPATIQQFNAENATFSLNTLRQPAKPGQVVVLWGTGLGPLASAQDSDSPPVGSYPNVTISVGGTAVTPLYAGRAPGFPGVDQINFSIPDASPIDCFVPVTVYSDRVPSGALTLSVSTGGETCRSELGLSASTIERLDDGGKVRLTALTFDTSTSTRLAQNAEAWTADYDAAGLALLLARWDRAVPSGLCARYDYSYDLWGVLQGPLLYAPDPPAQYRYGQVLADSTSVRVTGSNGCNWQFTAQNGVLAGAGSSSCPAVEYSVTASGGGQATGALPAARAAMGVGVFSVADESQRLLSRWSTSIGGPDDRATVNLSSSVTRSGGGMSLTSVRGLACDARAAAGSLAVDPWAFGLFTRSAVFEVSTVSLAAFPQPAPGPDAVEAIVVLTRSRASRSYLFQ